MFLELGPGARGDPDNVSTLEGEVRLFSAHEGTDIDHGNFGAVSASPDDERLGDDRIRAGSAGDSHRRKQTDAFFVRDRAGRGSRDRVHRLTGQE